MRFLAGMFKQRKAPALAEAPKPKPKQLPPEAAARREQEREEAEREEELRRVSREEIEQACKQLGHWWPGEVGFENRLSGRPSWRSRLAARLFGGGA